MGDISYRNWDIWVNKRVFDTGGVCGGFFECILLPSLMVSQTVEFLTNGIQIYINKAIQTQTAPPNIIASEMTSIDGKLCLKMSGSIDTGKSIEETIASVLETLDALSICVDIALVCNQIHFVAGQGEHIFSANRRPIARGMSFEVEERCVAKVKLLNDLTYYKEADNALRVGIKHYLAGMSLMGLEDQVSGLTDAAFMQFFQGCEAVCKSGNTGLRGTCKYIANLSCNDSRELQIIAHHIYQVRNHYFGHGDVIHNKKAIDDYITAMQATKQLLVVRYLCKRLIDAKSPSGNNLIRETGFYPWQSWEGYRGSVEELSSNFKAEYEGRVAKVYDTTGKVIEKFQII